MKHGSAQNYEYVFRLTATVDHQRLLVEGYPAFYGGRRVGVMWALASFNEGFSHLPPVALRVCYHEAEALELNKKGAARGARN